MSDEGMMVIREWVRVNLVAVLGCGDAGMEAAERVIRAGLLRLGAGMLGIIALRCREASSQWEAVCNTPDTQTRTA